MFEIKSSAKRFDANKVIVYDTGKYPYIVRMGTNNGQKGYINEDIIYLNEGNTISFGQDTATMFYQEKPYFTGDKIKILKSKYKEFNKKNAQFILSAMTKTFSNFSWGNSSFSIDIIENQIVEIPIESNKPNFSFMEKFIAELEAERLAELEAYLKVTGFDDYNLTEEEKAAVENLSFTSFKEFNITEIFSIKNTGNILSRNIVEDSGSTPYLCASAENNAVSSYIIYDDDYLDKGNCVFIGGKTFVVTYQEKDFYSNDSHNLVLYLKNKKFEKPNTLLYMVACIIRSMGHKYSWGDSISKTKIQSDLITLPMKDGKPDYESMSLIISAVKKMVIKDVVQYSDRKIKMTKEVCSIV